MSDYALIFIDLLSSPINSKPFQGYLHTNRDMKTFFDIYFAETDVYLLTGSKPNCKTKQKKTPFTYRSMLRHNNQYQSLV